jgi:tetratricopeptide (TPR) repeat protein
MIAKNKLNAVERDLVEGLEGFLADLKSGVICSAPSSLSKCEEPMMPVTGNSDPRVVAAINEAINLAANGQTLLAVEILAKVAAEFPEVASVRGYLAWFMAQIGRYREAVEQSQQAVNLEPESERASLVHFHVLWKAGNHIQALDEMKRFLLIRPSAEYTNIIRDWEPRIEEQ